MTVDIAKEPGQETLGDLLYKGYLESYTRRSLAQPLYIHKLLSLQELLEKLYRQNKELISPEEVVQSTNEIFIIPKELISLLHTPPIELIMEQQSFTFTNDQDEYPTDLKNTLCKSLQMKREYFLGLCSFCYMDKGTDQPLHRCAGCQLLAYCSKDCQKMDWAFHKPICKQFPLTNGRNVFSEASKLKKDARNKHIDDLKSRALKVGNTENSDKSTNDPNSKFVRGIFEWPRVCNICKEADVDKLTDCPCHSVSYCTEGHRKADKAHKDVCYDMLIFARSYSYLKKYAMELNLPTNTDVDKKYIQLDKMNFHVSSMKDENLDNKLAILSERLSYPMTILYGMQQAGLGVRSAKVETASSLNIHVVCSNPMLDSLMWEMLIHRLPLLNELNISFIGVKMALDNHLNIGISNKLERCEDCKSRNRLITYNIYPEHYHMHFSSMEYNEPDVIVIFNISEMSQGEEDHVHAVTSYRNMTYDDDTLIILTDSEIEELEKGIKDINEARPVDVVIPSSLNPFRGLNLVRGTQDKPMINTRDKLAVLRRKCDEEIETVSNEEDDDDDLE